MAFIYDVKDLYDYVLIDLPSGSGIGVKICLEASDRAILVTTPNRAALRTADKIKSLIGRMKNIKETDVIINRAIPQLIKTKETLSADDIYEILGLNIYGEIPESIDIIKSMNSGVPLTNTRNETAKKIALISSAVCGEAYKSFSNRQLYKTIRKKYKQQQ